MAEKEREVSIKTNDLLASYISEFGEDVRLTYVNLREKSLMCSSIWAKWLSYLYKEKENLQRIAETKQKLIKKKMSSSKMTDSIIRQKNEDRLSETDDTMKKLNVLQKNTQTNVEYIERALNILQNFGFTVKNAMEAYKLNFEH